MIPKLFITNTALILLMFTGSSCQKDKDNIEPEITSEFKLLDENKEAVTIFTEGENFYFHFSIQSNDREWKFNRFVNKDSNFFRVHRIEGDQKINVGVPFKSYWCQAIHNECGHDTPFVFEIPWVTGTGENEIPNQEIYPPFCMFYETNHLPKGTYLTYFDDSMEFVKCGKELENGNFEKEYFTTELKHFEIRFEIK